ncbi:MAG TPA: hypothetical protein VGH40_15325 [Roseiarcus sp.]|jgi:hypothetical protein
MMHSDNLLQNAFQNPTVTPNPSLFGQSAPQPQGQFGQAAMGQGAYGAFGNPMGGQSAAGGGWGAPQRQLSQQDVSNILQQIAPVLPQIIAQAQQNQYQPMAAYGGGFGGQRSLSPQDVSEVVRQILPIIPQLVQSMQQQGGQMGLGQLGLGQMGLGQGGQGMSGHGWQGQAAYGGVQQTPFQQQQPISQRLTHHDVHDIVRQLSDLIQQQASTGQLRL